MITGEAVAESIRRLRDETYRLTCEQGVEIHLPDNAFDQLALYAREFGVHVTGRDDPRMTFEGVAVWRKGSYGLR
jgi:hypothetical protein